MTESYICGSGSYNEWYKTGLTLDLCSLRVQPSVTDIGITWQQTGSVVTGIVHALMNESVEVRCWSKN